MFQCGLVLVDSPGIGENDAMDEVITEFVSAHDIMGFLYAIKSDNAGGVDEDRVWKKFSHQLIIFQKKIYKYEISYILQIYVVQAFGHYI